MGVNYVIMKYIVDLLHDTFWEACFLDKNTFVKQWNLKLCSRGDQAPGGQFINSKTEIAFS
jgi:hypothetical protein